MGCFFETIDSNQTNLPSIIQDLYIEAFSQDDSKDINNDSDQSIHTQEDPPPPKRSKHTSGTSSKELSLTELTAQFNKAQQQLLHISAQLAIHTKQDAPDKQAPPPANTNPPAPVLPNNPTDPLLKALNKPAPPPANLHAGFSFP